MPIQVSEMSRDEQALNWGRAFLCGVFGSWILMAIIDIFAMLGITHFCMEIYVGTILRGTTEYEPRAWIVGFFANWLIGGLVGLIYGFCFESIFHKANGRIGVGLGLMHSLLAAFAIFPFLGVLRDQMGLQIYAHGFGFFGSSLDAGTPIILLFSHLAFGACMGTFYGPVRTWRIRSRDFEPGEQGEPGDPSMIRHDEDPRDRTAIGYY